MNKKIIGVLIFCVAACLVFIVILLVFRKNPTTVKKEKASYTIGACQLIGEFEEDEEKAMSKYGEKIIIVTGKVDQVIRKEERTIVMLQTDGMGNVSCLLGKGVGEMLDKSKEYRIKGICSGYTIDVLMKQCYVME